MPRGRVAPERECQQYVSTCRTPDCDFAFRKREVSHLRECPTCHAARPKCVRPAVQGRTRCRSHGGAGGKRKMLMKQAMKNPTLTPADEAWIADEIKKDDPTLTPEFHVGRRIYQRSVSHVLNAKKFDLDEARDALAMLNVLAGVANTRDKRLRAAVEGLNFDFENPAFQARLREHIVRTQIEATRKTVRFMLELFDHDDQMLAKLPVKLQRLVREDEEIRTAVEDATELDPAQSVVPR